ncbi:hypothetical protein HHI36_021769 [Cryptolaemus montrouzieri]|uniref:Small acidic protein-like domain-containing protein n=1 Tax=Cryptolaemus montrouzieri TaxID=559131 RepID=A0ABD2MZ49_9CUCU
MDSLANYGSDDDYEDSPEEQQTESNDGSRNGKETRDKDSSGDDRRSRNSPNDRRRRDDYRNRRDRSKDRSRSRDRRDARDDDRVRDRKDDRYGSKADRYSRDDKGYKRDSYRDRKYRRSSSRDRRRSSSNERRRSSSRDRRRSSSRERRYSRSPKRDRSRRSRSRSRSRGRYTGGPPRKYGYQKNGPRTETSTDNQSGDGKDRFFMPGITGKYREQIEKRKLLWQKKDPQKPAETVTVPTQNPAGTSTSRVTKIWETTTFAQDQDGKVASKFKRLMGIKGQSDTAPAGPTDIIKKQEEMFNSMEQQYEVARTATHTMRGVGLGFSSNYPR